MAASIRLAPKTKRTLDHFASHTGKAYRLREIIDLGSGERQAHYLVADVLEHIRTGQEQESRIHPILTRCLTTTNQHHPQSSLEHVPVFFRQ